MKIQFVVLLVIAAFGTACPAQKPDIDEPTDIAPDTATDDCEPGEPGCEEAVLPDEGEGALDDADFVEDAPFSGDEDEEPLEGGPE